MFLFICSFSKHKILIQHLLCESSMQARQDRQDSSGSRKEKVCIEWIGLYSRSRTHSQQSYRVLTHLRLRGKVPTWAQGGTWVWASHFTPLDPHYSTSSHPPSSRFCASTLSGILSVVTVELKSTSRKWATAEGFDLLGQQFRTC